MMKLDEESAALGSLKTWYSASDRAQQDSSRPVPSALLEMGSTSAPALSHMLQKALGQLWLEGNEGWTPLLEGPC